MTRYRILIILFMLLLHTFVINAQNIISGTITDNKQQPVAGASITLKGTYDGSTTDSAGRFSFHCLCKGEVILVISHVGYDIIEQRINIEQQDVDIKITLYETVSELKAVTVTAGTFEASDKRRATVLKTIDIVTTAGAQADIFGAINTLPGAQQIGESEGLFVRGGTGAETKVFIDGLTVNNPFNSSVPDIAQRGRFSPLLFKGTVFSSGGYSAQYGQGMSSALILESVDLPIRSEAQVSATTIGVLAIRQQLCKSKKSSYGGSLYYGNMHPYFQAIKQIPQFTKAPENLNAEFFARKKLNSNGMLKLYIYTNYNTVALNRQSLDYEIYKDHFSLLNKNVYLNASYLVSLQKGWKLNTGLSVSFNDDKINKNVQNKDTLFNLFTFIQKSNLGQARIVLTKSIKKLSKIYLGTEVQYALEKIILSSGKTSFADNYISLFAESDIYITQNFVSRIGIRHEHSGLLKENNIAPRISVAYKLNDNSQFSLAFGQFYQKPESRFLFANNHLSFSKASHYILNFQQITKNKVFRAEIFIKNYNNLITYDSTNLSSAVNKGNGTAKGLEIFWRDKKGFKGIDYWISYSFLDTKRKFLNYPYAVQPSFAAKHTLNVVMKRFVNSISTNFGLTYTFASGRPYYNPNKSRSEFMSDRTIDYHSLGITINYLTQIKKANSVIFLYVTNVFGNKQVFGYNYGTIKNSQGIFFSSSVTPPATRFIMLGLFMSIGVDRRQDVINNN